MQTPDEFIRDMAKTNHPADNNGIRKRIKQLIEIKYNDRQGELASLSGIQPAALSNILTGKKPASVKQLRQIESVSRARLDWLLSGAEPMYHPVGWVPLQTSPVKEGEYLRRFVDAHRSEFTQRRLSDILTVAPSTIGDYFKTSRFDEPTRLGLLNALQQLTGNHDLKESEIFGEIDSAFEPGLTIKLEGKEPGTQRTLRHIGNFSGEPMAILPFVPIRARAGVATPQYWEQPPETIRIMRAVLMDYEPDPYKPKKNWWIIGVDGDSMEPQLLSRAKVLGHYVYKENIADLKPGVWAIQYDDEFVIKRVRANNFERDGGIWAHSDNPPPDPYFIEANRIHHVWFIEKQVDSPVR